MAVRRRGRVRDVTVHSDRGSHYCSHRYYRLRDKHHLVASMSKRGDCCDNACAESFFHSLKVELTHGERYATRQYLRQQVFEYVETYYNLVRCHSALDYVSPVDFELNKVA
jgi:putative transposase